MFRNGRRGVGREHSARNIAGGHEIKRGNRVGRIAALRNSNIEGALGLGVFELDERLGRHHLHLAVQHALQQRSSDVGGILG